MSALRLRTTPLECYAGTPNLWYLSSKKMWALIKAQGCSFSVVPLRFHHSMNVKIPWTHLVVRLIERPFFSNFSGDLDCKTPAPTAMAVFLEIAQPAIRRLCRIVFISAVNSWDIILAGPGPLKVILLVVVVSWFAYLAW